MFFSKLPTAAGIDRWFSDLEGEIELHYYCDLTEALYGDITEAWKDKYARVKAWISEHDAFHYSAEREDFSIYTALEQAKAHSKKVVVCSDLS